MSEFKKILTMGFFWMFLGGILVQVVQFISKIFLARWLSPQDFGVISLAISIVAFAGLFHDFGLSSALIQRIKNIEDAFNTVTWFVFFSGGFISSALLVFSSNIANYFGDEKLNFAIKLTSITIFIGALSIPYISYLSKNLLFFRKFFAETIPILLGSFISIILAYYKFGYLSLAIGFLSGSVFYLLILFFITPWKPKFQFKYEIFTQLIKYGKFIFFSNLLSIFLSQGDNFIVGNILGSTNLGYYAVAYSIAVFPSISITHIFSRVLFPAFAILQNDKINLKITLLKSLEITCGIVFPIITGTIILAPFIFNVILGEKWIPAYHSLILLSFLAVFRSLQIIPSFFLQATGYSKEDAGILFKSALIEIIFIFPLIYAFKIEGASLTMTVSFGYGFIAYIIKCYKLFDITLQSFFKKVLPSIISSIIMYFSGILTINILKNNYTFLNLILVVLICFSVYLLISFILNRKMLTEIKNLTLSFFNKNQ